jgi:hypothetical protein
MVRGSNRKGARDFLLSNAVQTHAVTSGLKRPIREANMRLTPIPSSGEAKNEWSCVSIPHTPLWPSKGQSSAVSCVCSHLKCSSVLEGVLYAPHTPMWNVPVEQALASTFSARGQTEGAWRSLVPLSVNSAVCFQQAVSCCSVLNNACSLLF